MWPTQEGIHAGKKKTKNVYTTYYTISSTPWIFYKLTYKCNVAALISTKHAGECCGLNGWRRTSLGLAASCCGRPTLLRHHASINIHWKGRLLLTTAAGLGNTCMRTCTHVHKAQRITTRILRNAHYFSTPTWLYTQMVKKKKTSRCEVGGGLKEEKPNHRKSEKWEEAWGGGRESAEEGWGERRGKRERKNLMIQTQMKRAHWEEDVWKPWLNVSVQSPDRKKRWTWGSVSKMERPKNSVGNLHSAALMWVNHGENHDLAIS